MWRGIPKSLLLSTLKFFTFAKSLRALASEGKIPLSGNPVMVFPSFDSAISTYDPSVVVARKLQRACLYASLPLTFHHPDLVIWSQLTAGKSGKQCLHLCSKEMMGTHSPVLLYLPILNSSFLEII